MDTKEIQVQGVSVTVNLPYAEGHKINEAEARALNQYRAEGIANNQRKNIKALLEEEGATPESVQAKAQEIITAYDAEYEITIGAVGGGSSSRLDPLTKECRRVARDLITAKIKQSGMTLKEYKEKNTEEGFLAKVLEVSELPKVIEAAKKNLAQRESLEGITV